MWDVLRDNNLDLLRQVDRLQEDLEGISSSLLTELRAYYEWAVEAVGACGLQARQNLEDLELRRDEILPDILSSSQVATRRLGLLNRRLLSPLLASRAARWALPRRPLATEHCLYCSARSTSRAAFASALVLSPSPLALALL